MPKLDLTTKLGIGVGVSGIAGCLGLSFAGLSSQMESLSDITPGLLSFVPVGSAIYGLNRLSEGIKTNNNDSLERRVKFSDKEPFFGVKDCNELGRDFGYIFAGLGAITLLPLTFSGIDPEILAYAGLVTTSFGGMGYMFQQLNKIDE